MPREWCTIAGKVSCFWGAPPWLATIPPRLQPLPFTWRDHPAAAICRGPRLSKPTQAGYRPTALPTTFFSCFLLLLPAIHHPSRNSTRWAWVETELLLLPPPSPCLSLSLGGESPGKVVEIQWFFDEAAGGSLTATTSNLCCSQWYVLFACAENTFSLFGRFKYLPHSFLHI